MERRELLIPRHHLVKRSDLKVLRLGVVRLLVLLRRFYRVGAHVRLGDHLSLEILQSSLHLFYPVLMCSLILPSLSIDLLIDVADALRRCRLRLGSALVDGMTSVFVVALDLDHADAINELVTGTQQALLGGRMILDVIVDLVRRLWAMI